MSQIRGKGRARQWLLLILTRGVKNPTSEPGVDDDLSIVVYTSNRRGRSEPATTRPNFSDLRVRPTVKNKFVYQTPNGKYVLGTRQP